MRVLALATDGFGGFGGIARYNGEFLSALAAMREVEEVLVLPRYGGGETPPGVRQLRARTSRAAYTAALAASLAREPRFDLLWCGHIHMAALARLAAARLGCPWWLQLHGVEAWEPRDRPTRWSVHDAALVLAVSRYTRARFLAWSDLPPERVVVLPDTVDDRFAPGPAPDELRHRHGLEDCRVLLTVGRLAASEGYKGHDRVIRLLPRLRRTVPEVRYAIVGDGDDRPRLEALARELGVAQLVRFVGRVPDAALPDWYRLADLFVMPSTGEGFGIVYLEAMACGVPAVGLDRDGSVDPLSVRPLGQAVRETGLYDTLVRLLREPPLRHRPADLERFGRRRFRECVAHLVARHLGGPTGRSPERVAAHYAGLYRQVRGAGDRSEEGTRPNDRG